MTLKENLLVGRIQARILEFSEIDNDFVTEHNKEV